MQEHSTAVGYLLNYAAEYPDSLATGRSELDNDNGAKCKYLANSKLAPISVDNRLVPDIMVSTSLLTVFLLIIVLSSLNAHGPPLERDNEDIAMGRKMGAKWCSMAKVCNHDRVPVCGVSHAGDVMGFRDLCDMFDYNCIRRRNYKQTACPEDKSVLTVSRRPTNSYYDD